MNVFVVAVATLMGPLRFMLRVRRHAQIASDPSCYFLTSFPESCRRRSLRQSLFVGLEGQGVLNITDSYYSPSGARVLRDGSTCLFDRVAYTIEVSSRDIVQLNSVQESFSFSCREALALASAPPTLISTFPPTASASRLETASS